MAKRLKSLKLNTVINLVLGAVYIIASVVIVLSVNATMKREALSGAEAKARLLLDRNLATHTYFTHDLKPRLFKILGPKIPMDYFDPVWMSSTYAIRSIDGYFRSLGADNYYYKDAAINARTPVNEAGKDEQAFLQELTENPKLEKKAEVRTIEGKPYFIVMRRGEAFESTCLRCHSTPQNAPGDLVRIYGDSRSFNRQVGELASVVSIHIPLEEPYAKANRFSLHLSLILLMVLFITFATRSLLYRKLVFQPLQMIRGKAQAIANREALLGEQITLPYGRELMDLVEAFNTMSVQLRRNVDLLEERVQERTGALQNANKLLSKEIEDRKTVELEKEILIVQLKSALENIRTLKGLLPICASCKKVRNDQGYWEQIETYIRDRSDAEFSHSICPECREKLYPKKNDDNS